MGSEVNYAEVKPVDALASRVWAGDKYHYPHIDGMLKQIADLTRQLGEARAELADIAQKVEDAKAQHAHLKEMVALGNQIHQETRIKLAEAEEAVRLAAEHFYLAEDDDAGWSMGEPSPNLGAARERARRELVRCKAFSAAVARARGGEKP